MRNVLENTKKKMLPDSKLFLLMKYGRCCCSKSVKVGAVKSYNTTNEPFYSSMQLLTHGEMYFSD